MGAKHFEYYIVNKIDGLNRDIKIKRAEYISKNNEIIQEFSDRHPKTIFKLSKKYNTHSLLWNMFGKVLYRNEDYINTW